MKRFIKMSPVTAFVLVVIVALAGTATAASGVGTLATKGDSGNSASSSQRPLGALSAHSPGRSGVRGENTGGGSNPSVKGETVTSPHSGSAGSVGHGKLPFTGFVAIPLLAAGAGLLLAGSVLRRRGRQQHATA